MYSSNCKSSKCLIDVKSFTLRLILHCSSVCKASKSQEVKIESNRHFSLISKPIRRQFSREVLTSMTISWVLEVRDCILKGLVLRCCQIGLFSSKN